MKLHSADSPTLLPFPRAAELLDAIPSLVDQIIEMLAVPQDENLPELHLQSEAQRRQAVERSIAMALGSLTRPLQGGGEEAAPGGPDGRTGGDPDGITQRLLESILNEERDSATELEALSRQAGWTSLPQRVQPVVLPSAQPFPRGMPLNTLCGLPGSRLEGCGLVLDSSPRAQSALITSLRGRSAAVGPVVPLESAGSAMRWTRNLLDLSLERGGRRGGVACVDDHLSTLLLVQDKQLSHALTQRWLQPLEGMTPQRRERLSSTLLAWLQEGSARQAAKVLNVHPQTVRYRMRQAENIFGSVLFDGRARLELELALRYQDLIERSGQARAAVWAQATRPGTDPGVNARVNGV